MKRQAICIHIIGNNERFWWEIRTAQGDVIADSKEANPGRGFLTRASAWVDASYIALMLLEIDHIKANIR